MLGRMIKHEHQCCCANRSPPHSAFVAGSAARTEAHPRSVPGESSSKEDPAAVTASRPQAEQSTLELTLWRGWGWMSYISKTFISAHWSSEKNMSQTKCSLVLSAVVINQGGWQGSCYIGKHWTKVHPGKWHHDMVRDWGVRCAVCNECKLRKCMGLYCGVKGNASNLKEKPIGPVQVAVWRHLVVVVFSDVASGPCSSGVSRTTVGIAGISTRSDDICQTEKIDQGTEYRLRTPCLSPCVLRQSLPLHHIPYPTEARTFTHHGNSVATTISNQPPWPHSENQSSFISSKPHWHGAVGWGIFYRTLEEWLQSSENYNRGQDCTFLNLFTATLLFAILWAVLPRASSCSWCLSQVLASDPGVQERLLSLTGALSLCLMLPLPSFSCLLFSPLHSFSIFLPTSN